MRHRNVLPVAAGANEILVFDQVCSQPCSVVVVHHDRGNVIVKEPVVETWQSERGRAGSGEDPHVLSGCDTPAVEVELELQVLGQLLGHGMHA